MLFILTELPIYLAVYIGVKDEDIEIYLSQ